MKQVNKQAVYRDSILQALKKLAPAVQVHNPVMFIVYIGAIFTTILFIANIAGITDEHNRRSEEHTSELQSH